MIVKQESLDHDIWLISLGGRLDQESTTEFENEAISILREGQKRLLVDFSQVTFINSGGLRCLVTVWRQAREIDAELFVAGLTDDIGQVFSMVGFDKVFNIFDDVEAVMALYARDKGLE